MRMWLILCFSVGSSVWVVVRLDLLLFCSCSVVVSWFFRFLMMVSSLVRLW